MTVLHQLVCQTLLVLGLTQRLLVDECYGFSKALVAKQTALKWRDKKDGYLCVKSVSARDVFRT